MFRAVCIAVLLAVVVSAVRPKWHELTPAYSYQQYLKDFKKVYHNGYELERRQKNFETSLAEALEHNSKVSTYKRGVNHLSDWDENELTAIRGSKVEPRYQPQHAKPFVPKPSAPVASSLDYRHHVPTILTAVKDQGQCGDCWAHAVTEAIESSYALATGELFVLSQQQITSCTPLTGSCYSCNGSFPSLAYDYAVNNGITEEWIYPFESYSGSFPDCKANPYLPTPIQTIVNISGYVVVSSNLQDQTLQALNTLGPVSILVDASSWSSYEGGIFDGCNYAKNISLDHAVQLVGYGTENGTDYWIVRNSWAPSWGEQGFIRLAKPTTVPCGWNVGAAHASGCWNVGPAEVWSCGMCGVLYSPMFPIALPN